jgi:tetratricopeptide (TPR) repeat protein
LDSMYARAYARIGIAYSQLALRNPQLRSDVSRDTALARAAAAASRALSLDSSLGDAWLAQGRVLAQRDSQPARALDAYRKAVAIDPNNAEAHNFYGFGILVHSGAIEHARSSIATAVVIDPSHPTYLNNLAVANFAARRFAEARQVWDSAVAVAPNTAQLHTGRAMASLALGDTGRAARDTRIAASLQPESRFAKAWIALLDIGRGDSAPAREIAARLAAAQEVPDANLGLMVAAILTALGDRDRALDYLEKVRPQQGYFLPLVLNYVFLDSLRSSPRFQSLVDASRVR